MRQFSFLEAGVDNFKWIVMWQGRCAKTVKERVTITKEETNVRQFLLCSFYC